MNLSEPQAGSALFWSKGFRPFFLAAAAFACVSMAVWMAALFFGLALNTGSVSYFQWHAHELLFGYASAVIAGFLLTAVINWTGRDTLSGYGLMMLVTVWLVARIGWLVGGLGVWVGGVTDSLFWLLLMVAIARPVIATKQWRQLGVLAKLLLMFSAHVFFFLDAIGLAQGAAYPAINIGLFSLIGLILMMLRRIFPFFVKAASNGQVELPNPSWVDKASLVTFTLFLVVFVMAVDSPLMPFSAAALGLVLLVRLLNWYHPFIWQAPLLWSLYLSLAYIVLGCWMLAWSYWSFEYRYLAVHALSYGGLGLASIGMLVRVSIGHSGGDVRAKRPWVLVAFIVFSLGTVLRVFGPIIAPQSQAVLLLSQVAWILSFGLCFIHLLPILTQSPQIGSR